MEQEQPVSAEVEPQELQEVESQEETANVENEENEVSESQPQVQEAAETIEESAPAPEAEEEEYDPQDYAPQQQQMPQIPPLDPSAFIDADGNVNWDAYNRAQDQRLQNVLQNAALMSQNAVQEATRQVQLQNRYQKDWQKAEDKYPELKGNRELKDMVQAVHAQSALLGKGKFLSPEKAADKLFGLRSASKAEGVKAATESRKVQSAATLASPNPPMEESKINTKDLKLAMTRGSKAEREAARMAYLKTIL